MKLKYFLRGLGTGILFTVAVLAISNPKVQTQTMTDAQVVERAKTLGMISAEELDQKMDDKLNEIDASEEPSASPSIEPSITPTVAPTITPTANPTVAPTIAPTQEPTPAPSKTPTQKEASSTWIKITSGMWSNDVADYLEGLGIIKDAKKFDSYLCENGYASKIRAGNYKIPTGLEYAQIADIITK